MQNVHRQGVNDIPIKEYEEELDDTLTKYGMLRKTFLKEYHSGIYNGLLLTGKLYKHCLIVQQQAELRAERMIENMMRTEGVTEELKAVDQLEWVRRRNAIVNRVDEIILDELIYKI
ncbi:MAG: TnpV protein [Eubacterium sp.]|nr:TnpV protein [Eubacterium sp.]